IEVKLEKTPEWIALYKSEVLPALRKAGVKDAGVATAVFGARAGTYYLSGFLDKATDLDGQSPLERGMGAEGFRKFLQKVTPMTASIEQNVFRVRTDLSYIPQAAASGSAK